MKRSPFLMLFSLAGCLLLVFILLPLAGTLFSTPLDQIGATLGDPEVGQSIALTFTASAIANAVTLLTGLPLAYLLARYSFRGKRLVESVIDLPVVVPHTAAGIALLLVFGSQGILGRGFAQVGIHFVDTLAGTVVCMAFVSLPYLVNLSREAFARIQPELEQAAQVDGASRWQSFWWISLPIAWRGVVGGFLMMWARGISEFGSVVILAYHPKVVPVLIFERFQGFGLKAAQPVAVLLILVVLVIFVFLRSVLLRHDDDSL